MRRLEVVLHDSDEQPSTTENEGEQRDAPKKRAKRSKKQDANGQRTILQGLGIKSEVAPEHVDSSSAVQDESRAEAEADLDADPNHARRKRQKTASPEHDVARRNGRSDSTMVIPDSDDGPVPLDWRQQLEVEASSSNAGVPEMQMQEPAAQNDAPKLEQVPQTANGDAATIETATHTTPTKPADEQPRPGKTMRLKGGKLASPVTKKQESPKTPKRGRRAKAAAGSPSLVVKVDYGKRSPDPLAMAKTIQRILDGETVHTLPVVEPQVVIPKPPPAPSGPPKVTHPFFTGKLKKPDPQEHQAPKRDEPFHQSPRKLSVTTPGKLRSARDAFRMPGSSSPKRPAPVQRTKLKHLGDHPAWPMRDNVHVRGIDDPIQFTTQEIRAAGYLEKSSKRKHDSFNVDDMDNVLSILAGQLHVADGYVRLPEKLVTTGKGLQDLVREQLTPEALDRGSHPAIRGLFSSIESSLSAFDKFECDTQAWTQKYAPKSATDILQAGQEAHVLKDWLQRSTITAVQTSSKRSTASSTVSMKKKRKRKEDDDSFIVDSDEEFDELNELLPLTDSTRKHGDLRSMVRGGDDYAKSTPASTLLLSGPNGCGKTATVFAVAKELGFEVFELNSASRRSGKDVLDKIGDMTENHLVQQVSKALTEDKPIISSGSKIEAIKIDEPDAPDPKQKRMASFFKSGPAVKTSKPQPKQMQKSIAMAKDIPKSKSRQKQSLILFEEVDVLFEEDKQFWLTILTLAAHSKRPIIMTCNDEHYIPGAFEFHAILRFFAPPIDLAADYLLLLASCEGHILERKAVESLYRSKGHDLRGSIAELDFWCQMAVGDPTRGFNWMLDRYPPGSDVDGEGRTLRTGSKNTFVRGINAVPNDFARPGSCDLSAQEELWSEAWDEWQVEAVSDCTLERMVQNRLDDSVSLDSLADKLEAISFGDMCTGFTMRAPSRQPIDATAPPLREKTIASYALGWTGFPNPLQADPVSDYAGLDKHLTISTQLRATDPLRTSADNCAEDVIHSIEMRSESGSSRLSRNDFASALDVFAADPEDASMSISTIIASSFDREFRVITTDLAPYLRTIAREYQIREEERLRMSNLLSQTGRKRQTRNAYAAIDGGRRSDRKARYFEMWRKMGVDAKDVLATGGEGWVDMRAVDDETRTGTASVIGDQGDSLRSTQ